MFARFRSLLAAAGAVDLAVTYGAPVVTSGATIWAGFAGGIPTAYVITLAAVAFAVIAVGWKAVTEPSAKTRERRWAVRRLCASSYQITESWTGSQHEFFAALSDAAVIFEGEEEVEACLSRLREGAGLERRDFPDLVQAMGRACRMSIKRETVERPFAPRLRQVDNA